MEGTYEYELERAELLGVEPISREQWEAQNKARKEAEVEQEQTEIAAEMENEGESVKKTHGKMDELNNILNATQSKINKFKTVCGSFTSLLKIRTASPARSESGQPDQPTSTNGEASTSSNINDALDNLDKMKEVQQQSDMKFAQNQAIDISSKINKNMDALDSLLAKSERAEMSLQHQNKQMSKFLR